MTPATDLCPASDAAPDIQADAMQQPGTPNTLTLYRLADDIVQLLATRAEMAENREDTADIDAAIAQYLQQLPDKVDAVAAVLRTLESQEALASEEIARLNARRHSIAANRERLESYCCDILAQLPKPKRGSRRLEGGTATLSLVANGGQQAVEISDPELIPDEYCTAVIRIPWNVWLEIREEGMVADRVPSNKAIREALSAPCWLCGGTYGTEQCSSCGGTGHTGVPGARLLDRGAHLKIS